MDPIDFAPATGALRDLVLGTSDELLGLPTPCPDYRVADLCDHLGGLTIAFTAAARKQRLADGNASGDGSRLEPGWRERIATDLDALAAAWRDSAAYDGMTQAGPIDLPAEVAALVALDEVVVHGWDLAVATGRAYDPAPAAVALCTGFAASFEVPEGAGDGPFGPPVDVGADATPLQRLVGLTGRDPGWRAML